MVRQGGWSPGLGPLRWRCTSNSVAAAHDLQGVLVLDGKLEQWACPDVFHCRRRIPSQSHPSSKPAALCSPVQCNMQRCAARTISVLSVPTAVVQMLACACENACAGHGADVRCWILTGGDGECKAQAQACTSHEPPPRFGGRPAGREQHVCRRERWVPESVCMQQP